MNLTIKLSVSQTNECGVVTSSIDGLERLGGKHHILDKLHILEEGSGCGQAIVSRVEELN